jgi:hypothetical protein
VTAADRRRRCGVSVDVFSRMSPRGPPRGRLWPTSGAGAASQGRGRARRASQPPADGHVGRSQQAGYEGRPWRFAASGRPTGGMVLAVGVPHPEFIAAWRAWLRPLRSPALFGSRHELRCTDDGEGVDADLIDQAFGGAGRRSVAWRRPIHIPTPRPRSRPGSRSGHAGEQPSPHTSLPSRPQTPNVLRRSRPPGA